MGDKRGDIIRLLTSDGSAVGDYFIVGDSIMHMSEMAGMRMPMILVVEDDPLADACIAFLREEGARDPEEVDHGSLLRQ
jgi:hypothetical protein